MAENENDKRFHVFCEYRWDGPGTPESFHLGSWTSFLDAQRAATEALNRPGIYRSKIFDADGPDSCFAMCEIYTHESGLDESGLT